MAQKAPPRPAAAERRTTAAATRPPALRTPATAPAASPLGNQSALHALGLQMPALTSTPGDGEERQADRLADAFAGQAVGLPHARHFSGGGGGGGMGMGMGRGQALPDPVRRDAESFFATDLSRVRVHTDAAAGRAAAGLQARAFAERDNIYFALGQFDPASRPGRLLLGHELAHVWQQSRLPAHDSRLRRQPDSQPRTDDAGFVTPPELQDTSRPATVDVPLELQMDAPSLADPARRRARDTELLSFPMTTEVIDRYLFYAVPGTHVFATPEEARASGLRPPMRQALGPSPTATTATPVTTTTPAVTATPATTPAVTAPAVVPAAAPAAAVGTTVYTPDGHAHTVIGATAEAVVTATYTRFAVGAGSTSLLSAGGQFIVIDAGTFGPAGSAVADATLRALEARIGRNGVIAQILITHAHADHMSLLPELATRFRIGAIRINALQADRPDFRALLELVRQAHQARVNAEADRIRTQLANERPAWEIADRGDPMTRQRRWNELRDQRLRTALEAIPDIQLERLVPGARGRLAVTALPIDPATFRPQTVGTPTEQLAPGVRAPAVTDPDFADELGRRGSAGPRTAQVDLFSSSWVVDVRGHTRFLVLPDIRGAQFANLLHNFRSAVEGLGMEARFQVWDVSHHMQIGWSGGGTATAGAPSVRATQLGHISRFLHTFRAGSRSAPGTDVVVVSAYEGYSTRGTSYVDPAHVWLLRSLGFEVFLATSGHDVQVLEAITSQGRRVTGVVGEERGGLRPRQQLMRRAEAALAELRDTARLQRAELRRARTPADRTAAQTQLDQTTARIDAIDRLRLAYLDGIHQELGRTLRGTAPGTTTPRPAVAPAPGAPEPAVAQAQALEQRLTAEGFTRAVPTTGSPRFSDAAIAVIQPGLLDPNAPAGSAGALALELARSMERIRAIESRPPNLSDAAANRAELLAELHRYRIALEAQVRVPGTGGVSRQVLDDQLRTARERITQLTPGPETRTIRQRVPGTGALVDTQIVAPQRIATASARPVTGDDPARAVRGDPLGRRPGLGERSGAAIGGVAERGFGALMVYQTFTAEMDVLARAAEGSAGGAELAATTAHSALGVTVGYRMLRGTPVSNGVFVVLSILEVAQAASRDYASSDQRDTEVAYAALRAGVNLGLMGVGMGLMALVPPPIGVLAGLGVMLLGEPILEALGAHDWIERLASFQPRQVTAVEQQLRTLIDEYQVIVGSIELAERTDASLRSVGATDPAATRAAAQRVADQHRIRAIPLEHNILSAFNSAYDRAQGAYAGLAELDDMRRRFYELMQRAHPHNEEIDAFRRARTALLARYDLTEDDFDANGRIRDKRKRRVRQWVTDEERQLLDPVPTAVLDQARTTFEGIERRLSLATASPSDIQSLEQWHPIDRKLDEINGRLVQAYFAQGNEPYEDFIEMESEARRMVDNARYRVQPPPGGYRAEPLLPPTAPGYSTYMHMLEQRERRLWWTQHRLSDMNAGRTPPPHQGQFELGHSAEELESQPSASMARETGLNLRLAEAGLRTYQALLMSVPHPPQDLVRNMFTNSADARSAYAAYIDDHDDYRDGLRRIEMQQTLLLAMTERAQRVVDPGRTLDPHGPAETPERERLRQLMLSVQRIFYRRHDELGMVFPSEVGALVGRVREAELKQLGAALGVGPEAEPLSAAEQRAGREALIREVAPQLGSTADRLARIPELRRAGRGGLLTGIYQLNGYVHGIELGDLDGISINTAQNALVGDLGPGEDDVRGWRRLRRRHPTRRVLPLNAAAITLLRGTGERQIRASNLHQISMGELRP